MNPFPCGSMTVHRGEKAHGQAVGQAERDVLEHELPPHEMAARRVERGREGDHGRQREPVVEARLEVEGVAHQSRHPRVVDHAGGEHGVGGREQRAEQEGLRPVEIREQLRHCCDENRGQGHRQDELAQGQVPCRL